MFSVCWCVSTYTVLHGTVWTMIKAHVLYFNNTQMHTCIRSRIIQGGGCSPSGCRSQIGFVRPLIACGKIRHCWSGPPEARPTKKRKRREVTQHRSSKKQKLRLSIHINPWTINSSRLRLLSERAYASVTTRTPPADTGHVHTPASAIALQLSSPPP